MVRPTPKQSMIALVAVALSATAAASASPGAPTIPQTARVPPIPGLGGLAGLLPPNLPVKLPPIFTPRPAPTPITSCNQTVTTNAVLTTDLTCVKPATGSVDGIIAGANGITINLNHHTIAAPATFNAGTAQGVTSGNLNGVGVLAIGFSDVTIENGSLTGWLTGIRLRAIEARAASATAPAVTAAPNAENVISAITVPDCAVSASTTPATAVSRGIDIAEPGSADITVAGASITGKDCGQAIRVHEAQGVTVKSSTLGAGGQNSSTPTAAGDGIVVDCGGSNTITDNTISWNARYGIYFGQADHNDVEGNTVNSNGSHGVFFGPPISGECSPATSSHNTVAGNQITGNHGSGIVVGPSIGGRVAAANSGENTLRGNTIAANTLDGIALEDTDNDAVANKITGNLVDGILVDTSSANDALTQNAVSGNQTNGVVVNGQSNVLRNNNSMSNKGDGFSIVGSPTSSAVACDESNCSNRLGGNQATGNAGGGLHVSAGNTDLGGNTGASNGISGENCSFGTTPCM